MMSSLAVRQAALPMMLMEAAMILLDDSEQFLLEQTEEGTWRLPTEVVLEGERFEEAAERYVRKQGSLRTSPLEMIDMTMDKTNINKVTALVGTHIASLPKALSVFSFNELPIRIEAQTVDHLASYIAYKMA